jgi:alkaline phosphatase D
MGRPLFVKTPPRPAGTSRRGFFLRTGAAAVAAASVPAATLAQLGPSRRGLVSFLHGVASGDPLSDRVILWTRATPAEPLSSIAVTCVVARDPAMRHVVHKSVAQTGPDQDYTIKFDPTGLEPGTTYYYRFGAAGRMSPIGRTRTLPVGDVDRLRIAVASCSNHAFGYFNGYARIAERADLDLVLHLGDYIYEYGPNQYGSAREPDPPFEIITLSDYRRRHAQYKADVDSQAMHRQHPVVPVWDDHESSNNAWRDGAENHTPGLEGQWDDRVHAALKAYYEWMPVRVVDPERKRENYRRLRIGNLVDLLMLETRLTARSEQLAATVPTPFGNGFVQSGAFADPARTLLGDEQEAWLAMRLRTSTTQWRLIGQQVMFAQLKLVAGSLAAGGGVFLNTDQWDGYQPARNRIYAVIEGDGSHPPVPNCVILTGDIHSTWAADLTRDPNNPDLATGGYDPASGTGSRAVEFVGTSITSPGVNDPGNNTAALLRTVNPHFKHIDLNQRGYMLLDVTAERVVCEWWYVDTVVTPSPTESFGIAFATDHGQNRLRPAARTEPRADAPPLAP